MQIPPVVLEDTAQDILLPSLTRNRPLHNPNRYFAHISLLRSRPALPRQPSLPILRNSVPSALSSPQPFILPRARSHHVIARAPAVALASQPVAKSLPPLTLEQNMQVLPPTHDQNTRVLPRARSHHVIVRRPGVSKPAAKSPLSPIQGKNMPSPATPASSEDASHDSPTHDQNTRVLPRARSHHVIVRRPGVSKPAAKSPLSPIQGINAPTPAALASPDDASQDLERQKLNALVIASGLADENELRASGPSNNSSPSRVYPKEPNRVVPAEVESSRDRNAEDYASSVATQAQFPTDSSSTRASSSLHDLDEFDDDASYYGKEMHPLFSPYSPLSSGSKAISPVSKWSLSSSVEDLRSKRSSTSKSLKSKGEKIKSFISRFSSNGPSSNGDKHVLSFPVDEEKSISRQRSNSDVLESVTGRSSVSSRDPPLAYASWESAPGTPSTSQSTTSISVSTNYSLATPSDDGDDFNDYPSARRRYSDEKFPAGKTASPGEMSPISLTRHTSSSSLTWPGTKTSVAGSSVAPLEHSISIANLKTHGLKGFVSKIGRTSAEALHEESSSGRGNAPKEEKPSASVPRTFRERMMLKNNGSALSLILGKSGNKATKPKRKLLISGIEQGNYKKYEAISCWCEVSSRRFWYISPNFSPQGFGEVTVDFRDNGIIVADFKDVNVAHTVSDMAS